MIAAWWMVVLVAGCSPAGELAADPQQPSAQSPSSPFLVKPYLQAGDAPGLVAGGRVQLLWHTEDADAEWSVEYRPAADRPWQAAPAPSARRIVVETVPPHRLYRTALDGLAAGGEFAYRVRKQGEVVFEATGRGPRPPGTPQRFVVFGDCGANTREQREIACRTYEARPDYVMITGDIVYSRGRISEYREKFWPIYNADEASSSLGAPLLRSTLFLAAPGNHDIGNRDLGKFPDGLAYFLYWAQPLNGPSGEEGSAHVPHLLGPEANKQAFRDAAGANYPRMDNFSFDYGDAHWTVLDANPYMDWTDRELRAWVERDLAASREATWRFVAIHQPGFQSSRAHADEESMRLMADVFEAGRVDIVFCGHVHNYQRTYPLRFAVDRGQDGKPIRDERRVSGRWMLDRSFDGLTRTRAEGVIYLVTGGGGARLYNPEQQDDPTTWKEFTHKFVSKVHSLTVAEVAGSKLTVRQLSLRGEELDRFSLTK